MITGANKMVSPVHLTSFRQLKSTIQVSLVSRCNRPLTWLWTRRRITKENSGWSNYTSFLFSPRVGSELNRILISRGRRHGSWDSPSNMTQTSKSRALSAFRLSSMFKPRLGHWMKGTTSYRVRHLYHQLRYNVHLNFSEKRKKKKKAVGLVAVAKLHGQSLVPSCAPLKWWWAHLSFSLASLPTSIQQ